MTKPLIAVTVLFLTGCVGPVAHRRAVYAAKADAFDECASYSRRFQYDPHDGESIMRGYASLWRMRALQTHWGQE